MAIPDKVSAGVMSLVALVPSIFTNDFTTPVIGVGVSTIAGAALGTYAAIGYDDTTNIPNGKMFALGMATVIIASALTGIIPKWMGWAWLNQGVEGGAAALASVICYYGLPPSITRAREIIRDFKFTDLIPARRTAGLPPPTPTAPPSDGEQDK